MDSEREKWKGGKCFMKSTGIVIGKFFWKKKMVNMRNPKSQALNPKQIPNPNIQIHAITSSYIKLGVSREM